MKKIILATLFCSCMMSIHAQDTCVGTNAFYPLKTSMRMGLFYPPNDSPDSIVCYSAAFGANSKAMGYASVAIGNNASTRGDYSFAGGSYSVASAQNAMAIGFNTLASGPNSASFGYQTIASNDNTFATGKGASASGYAANAMGSYTKAVGYSSTALGYFASTSGDMSLSLGMFTKSKSYAGMVVGLYNDSSNAASSGSINSNNRIFQIGNGTADDARSNAMTVLQNGNVGLGTINPISRLQIRGQMGFSSNSKVWQLAYDSVNHYFYIDELGVARRVYIRDGGNVGIGVATPLYKLEVSGNIKAATDIHVNNNLHVDLADANGGDLQSALHFGSITTGEGIASKRAGGIGNIYGLDFYTNNSNRMTITNSGNVGINLPDQSITERLQVSGNAKVSGNVIVQSNKGIIRSNDATQQKKLVTTVSLNYTFQAGETRTFTVTWPESFGATPDAFVGNIVSGAGGWAEVVMSLSNVTSTGATLYVYNPKTSTVVPNFTVKIIAIGAQ